MKYKLTIVYASLYRPLPFTFPNELNFLTNLEKILLKSVSVVASISLKL